MKESFIALYKCGHTCGKDETEADSKPKPLLPTQFARVKKPDEKPTESRNQSSGKPRPLIPPHKY